MADRVARHRMLGLPDHRTDDMTTAIRYLARAAELEAIAGRAVDPVVKAEWQSMATAYRKIAELADRNSEAAEKPEPQKE
jgi:hypothetical protein